MLNAIHVVEQNVIGKNVQPKLHLAENVVRKVTGQNQKDALKMISKRGTGRKLPRPVKYIRLPLQKMRHQILLKIVKNHQMKKHIHIEYSENLGCSKCHKPEK